MTIALSANTPRVSYTVNQGASQTSFAVPFVFFTASTDLNVFVDNVARTFDASTSNTSLYTVSGGSGSTGTVTTTVTGATGGSTVVITRAIPLSRTTDFPSSGAFEVAKLNTELDTVTAIQSDFNDAASRGIRLQDSDTAVSMELPLLASRKGTVLGFNASTGAAEAGPTIANVNSLSAITANINTVAGISGNVTTVAGISANTTTVAGISGNVSTVAGIASNVTTVAGKASLITSDFAADMALIDSTFVSKINLVTSDFVTDMAAVTSDFIADLNALATTAIIADLDLLATSDFVSDLNAVEGIKANVTTVAGIASNVTSVAGNSSNINSAVSNASNINSAVSNASNINSAVSNATNINSVVSNASNINTVAGAITNVNNVGGSITNVNTVATNLSGVNSFADRYRVASSAPSSSLDVGDLYFDTTANELKVYKSSGWAAAGSTVNGTSARFHYDISGTPTSVTGSDASGNTLAYDAGFCDVYVNGVRMSTADITITSGDTVTFASALADGDEVDIVAFGTFSVSNIVSTGALNSGSITSGFGNIDTGSSTITTTGVGTFGSLDISGDIDVDGTTNLDAVDIDGAVDMASTLGLDGALSAKGGAVFNENSADVDFRVESNDDANIFRIEGSTNNVKIGSNAGNYGQLSIKNEKAGSQERGLYVEVTPASGTSPNNVAVFSATNSNMTQPLVRIHHESPTADQLLLQATTTGSNTVKFSVDEDGDIYSAGGINLGGTGSANKLDEYEEGTWTPVYTTDSGNAPTATYSIQAGVYVRVGNLVHIGGRIRTDATSGGSGNLVIGGIPYVSISGSNYFSNIYFGYVDGWATQTFPVSGYMSPAASFFYVNQARSSDNRNGIGTITNVSSLTSGTSKNDIIFSGTYRTA